MNRISPSYSQHSHRSRSRPRSTGDYHQGHSVSRPQSAQLCELHVYKVPPQLWRGSLNNILNNVVTETVSLGIIRVPAELPLVEVREEIVHQLQLEDVLPRDYVFLRSVGRSLTSLRPKQEYGLKAKHFLPPVAPSPEVYILEVTSDVREALAITDIAYQSPLSRRTSPTHKLYKNSYGNGYVGNPENERSNYFSQANVHKRDSLSQIEHVTYRSPSPGPISDYYPYSSSETQYNKDNKHTTPPILQKPEQNPNTNQNYFIVQEAPQTQHYHKDLMWKKTQIRSKQTPPPRSADKVRDQRPDDDSVVAGLAPDDKQNRTNQDDYNNRGSRRFASERFSYDDETEAERQKRLHDLDETQRRALDDRRREEDTNMQREDRERRWREEEDGRKKEEQEKIRQEEDNATMEEERRKREKEEENPIFQGERQENEERLRNQNNSIAHFPSPPPLQMSSPEPEPEPERDTESAHQQRLIENEQLLRELEVARAARQTQEMEREELVKRAKSWQHKTTNRRNEARDLWKKKYFEEKKKTAPLEEISNRLRQELESLHRRLMNTLEGPKEKNMKVVDGKPSEKTNYVIQCTRLQHDIEDYQRRVENAKMKLTAEMKLRSQAQTELKAIRSDVMQNRLTLRLVQNGQTPRSLLRNQAEGELRALRAELTQKKMNINRNRQQQLAAMKPQEKELKKEEGDIDVWHSSHLPSSYQTSSSCTMLEAI